MIIQSDLFVKRIYKRNLQDKTAFLVVIIMAMVDLNL